MELISGIREPNSGKIKFKNSHHRLGEIAYMQQKDLLLPWLNVEENIPVADNIWDRIRITSENKHEYLDEKTIERNII